MTKINKQLITFWWNWFHYLGFYLLNWHKCSLVNLFHPYLELYFRNHVYILFIVIRLFLLLILFEVVFHKILISLRLFLFIHFQRLIILRMASLWSIRLFLEISTSSFFHNSWLCHAKIVRTFFNALHQVKIIIYSSTQISLSLIF